MLRRMLRSSVLLTLLLPAQLVFAQSEFSADVVNLDQPNSPTRIYFGKDKLRIDSKPGADPRNSGAVLIDFDKQTSTVLMVQQHMYMEMPMTQNQKLGYVNTFFRTGDVEAACGDWQRTTHVEGGTCRKVGSDSVNGRSTVKYEASNSSGEVSHFWVDPKLRFPVKWEGKKDKWELRNIQEGAQSASLFEIPAGYTKFDMGGMMRQPH